MTYPLDDAARSVRYRNRESDPWVDLGSVNEVIFYGRSGTYMEIRRGADAGEFPTGTADFEMEGQGLRNRIRARFISRSVSEKGEFLTYAPETVPKWRCAVNRK